jgi:hypothetical protein
MRGTPSEQPEDKDLQDHRFGMTVAEQAEQAERSAERQEPGRRDERRPEPHAGGKA